MSLTILIGRRYNLNTGETVPVLNTPSVVSQSNDSTYGNFWDMSPEELADAKSKLAWFAAMLECRNKEIPVTMELLNKIMFSPVIEEWEHFNRWFCFWVNHWCNFPSASIQFCFVE